MSAVVELLHQLHDRGARFTPHGDDGLHVDAPRGAVTPDDVAALRRHKPEVLAYLRQQELATAACRAIEADGLTLSPDSLLAELTPADYADADVWQPEALRAIARCIAEERLRNAGTIPPTYTSNVVCLNCGEVWLPPGTASPRNNCPWCFNRIKGRAIPRR